MADNGESIEISLNNVKDYYGYKFYRFHTDLSTGEVLKSVKEIYINAYYDKTEDKVVFENKGVEYKIEKEGVKSFLFHKSYKYLFTKNE